MDDPKIEKASRLEDQRKRAGLKVQKQADVVRRLNGSAYKRPEEKHLLGEMQQNKAVIDLNRAMFEYGQETHKPTDKD